MRQATQPLVVHARHVAQSVHPRRVTSSIVVEMIATATQRASSAASLGVLSLAGESNDPGRLTARVVM
jgi:hypothetical protein